MSRTYRTTTAYRYALVAAGLVLLVSLVGLSHLLRQKEREAPVVSGRTLEELLTKPSFQKQLQFRDAGFADALRLYTYFAGIAINRKRERSEQLDAINFNGAVDDKHVNVYFVFTKEFPSLAAFRNTCVYTGYRNIVICDLEFLDWMQAFSKNENVAGDKYGELSERIARASMNNVLLWILGHELGHLAHKDGAQHFTGTCDHRYRNYLEASRAPEEIGADQFAIDVAEEAPAPAGDAANYLGYMIQRGLAAFINRAGNDILRDLGRTPVLVSDSGIIPINARSIRDVLFVRAVNGIIVANKKYAIENTDYYPSLLDRISLQDKENGATCGE
jgi:hypothetical protein